MNCERVSMNKYQSTSRVMVLAFQILIFVLFGAFGCYYGFFAVPAYLTANPNLDGIVSGGYAYNLFLELAVIGLSEMTIAIYGIVQGIKGILDVKNDEPVVKGFTTFIVQGYLAAAFFFLNAFVFFDLVKGTNLTFIIIMAVLLTIVLMIATNIPMVRLYDNRDQKPLLASLAGGFAVVGAWIFVLTGMTMIGSFTQIFAFADMIRSFLLLGIGGGLVMAVLLGFAGYLLSKGKKDNSSKVAGYLSSGALGVAGAIFLVNGIFDLVWRDYACHLNFANKAAGSDYAYPIMSIVLGALLFIGAIAFAALNSKETANTNKHAA